MKTKTKTKNKPLKKRHKHNWVTTHSYGHHAFEAQCSICGERGTFALREQ